MKLPIPLLLLDLIGCILIGLGMAMHLAGIEPLPAGLCFEKDAQVFIGLGVVLMLPALLFMLRGLRKS